MAPYCTETEALFTGEMYASGDGTKVLELGDGTIILERKDGVQVSKVIASGFYCIDVESFQRPGTESNLNTLVTTIKVIVGGVAPLLMPWCIKNQGLVGGPLTVLGVGLLSQYTVKQLVEYRDAVVVETGRDDLTYVDVARHAFGDVAANSVFFMTIVNSLGVCAAYSSFIGSTMATLSATPGNIIFDVFPSITTNYWQIAAAAVVLPLNTLAGNSRFLSVVAYMGAGALTAGVLTTCWYGFSVTPDFLGNLAALPWFTTPQEYFTSFGVVPLLFCVHFAVLSIERNMKTRGQFPTVLTKATIACVIANALFGSLGFAFFGDATDSGSLPLSLSLSHSLSRSLSLLGLLLRRQCYEHIFTHTHTRAHTCNHTHTHVHTRICELSLSLALDCGEGILAKLIVQIRKKTLRQIGKKICNIQVHIFAIIYIYIHVYIYICIYIHI